MTEPAKTFTAEELSAFDGKEGRRSYVAYKGLVYDVTDSKLWRNGVHVRKHHAGNDLTTEMGPAPHEDDVMDSFEVVGRLVEEQAQDEQRVPWLWDYSNRRHLHPVTVHYPIALGMVASLLQAASMFTDPSTGEQLRFAAFINMAIATIFTIPAVVTGLCAWWYDYNKSWAQPYLQKNVLSAVLVVISIGAMAIWFMAPLRASTTGGQAFWWYSACVYLMTPVVLVLGYYGGKISFPD
ncbi:MAG: hypothetical protein H7A35_10430 [Planctomycetales bacterium]|nr:hypothetical protein [bacterium]UNM07285.1 MAG: hypothetical protein H7A35_10430 [Planctomycetales bacterium]